MVGYLRVSPNWQVRKDVSCPSPRHSIWHPVPQRRFYVLWNLIISIAVTLQAEQESVGWVHLRPILSKGTHQLRFLPEDTRITDACQQQRIATSSHMLFQNRFDVALRRFSANLHSWAR